MNNIHKMTIEEIFGKYDGLLNELKESYENIVKIIYKIKSGKYLPNEITELDKEYNKYLLLYRQLRIIEKIYGTLCNFSFKCENIYKMNRKSILRYRFGKLSMNISKRWNRIYVHFGDHYENIIIPLSEKVADQVCETVPKHKEL